MIEPIAPISDPISDLAFQVAQLQAQLHEIRGEMAHRRDPRAAPVLLARRTGSRKWAQQAVSAGSVVDAPGGLACTSDAHASAIVEPSADGTFLIPTRDADGDTARYLPIHPEWTIRITGNVSSGDGGTYGGGYYTGVVMRGPASPDADGGNLALPEGMSDGAACYVVNSEENALPTHWIKSGEYVRAGYLGIDPDDGKAIFIIGTTYYRVASAQAIVAADGKDYNRDGISAGDTYGDVPIKPLLMFTNEDGDKEGRYITFDAGGRLTLIGTDEEITFATVTQSGTDTIFVWDNITVIYPNTTVTGTGASGDPYTVTPSASGAGSLTLVDKLVKVTQDGTVTIYSGDARGRVMWFSANRTDDPDVPDAPGTPTVEDIQWGGAGVNPLSYRFGNNYDAGGGVDVALDGGATGSGNITVYLNAGDGTIYLSATGAGGAWADTGWAHVMILLGPTKPTSAPDHTI